MEKEDLIKLGLAVLAGGVLGAEREFRDKAAGFRTITLICVGACLFTTYSTKLGGPNMRDPARVAAQIVSGVGFLGAGAIMRDGSRVTGITTAATIWLAAAVGMGIGGGYLAFAFSALGAILIVLIVFPVIEQRIDVLRERRTYRVTCAHADDKDKQVEELIGTCGLKILSHRRSKAGADVITTWETRGTPDAHEKLVDHLLDDSHVREFTS